MTEQPASLAQHWRVADLRVGELSDRPFQTTNRGLATDVSHVHLVRPSYQRSLVWKRQKAEEFRTSLSKGYPFGVIVLAHEGVVARVNGMELPHHRYRIIDGQQRIYWLNKMNSEFLSDGWFFDEAVPDIKLLDLFATLAASLALPASAVTDLPAKIKVTVAAPGSVASPHSLLQRFIAATGADAPVDPARLDAASEAASLAWSYFDELRRAFSALPVPALIVEKELASSLPDVFVKLNSGLRLSRFDIFAADWAIVELNLDRAVAQPGGIDQQLADELVRYSQTRLSDADVEDNEYEVQLSEGDESVITLYEYLYALSKHVCNQNPLTLGAIPRADEELVLNVASLLFAGDIGRMESLALNFPKGPSGELDAVTFPQALIRAAEAINDALHPLLHWDLGRAVDVNHPTRRRSIPNAFGLLQAAAYIAAYIVNVYDVQPRSVSLRPNGAGVASTITNFKKSLRSWYLADAVTSPFKGSDAYAYTSQRVWTSFASRTPNPAMSGPVEWVRLTGLVKDYVTVGLEVDNTPQQRRLDQPGTGALLRFAYTGMQMVSNEDRDHVIPVAVLRTLPGAPANHLGNWMPLNRTDNRSRGANLWADCLSDARFNPRRNEIERLLFVAPATCSAAAVTSLDAFRRFLVVRYNAMVPRILQNLHHPNVADLVAASSELELPVGTGATATPS